MFKSAQKMITLSKFLSVMQTQRNFSMHRININTLNGKLIHSNPKTITKGLQNEGFIPVYKFPYIRVLSAINRLKLYQTVLTITTIPISLVLNQINLVHMDGVLVTCATGFSGCLVLYSLGYISEKFVGFIYINEEGNKAKLSYVDFWGRRRDEVIPIDDIVPLSDLPVAATDGLFLKFRRFSSKKILKLNLSYGIVLDKSKFDKIFLQI